MRARKRKLNGNGDGAQLELPEFCPVVHIPAIVVPAPGGAYLVKPGKPVVESDDVGTRRAARIMGLSQRRVQTMCEEGILEATRPGGGEKRAGNYRIKLRSVLARTDKVGEEVGKV